MVNRDQIEDDLLKIGNEMKRCVTNIGNELNSDKKVTLLLTLRTWTASLRFKKKGSPN